MPLYEYTCSECGNFEIVQKFSDAALESCPQCEKNGKKTAVSKKFSAPAFHLKGSGWYQSDYKGSAATGATSGKPSEATSAASTESSATANSGEASTSSTPAASSTTKACGGGCSCH